MEDNYIMDIIKNRWSPFSFSSKPVEEYKLKAILGAARYAPSSVNEQPWIFIFATRETPEKFKDFLTFLNESNQTWAKSAYALIVSLARTKHAYKDRPNRFAFHDTGMAVGNMLVQAASMDIYIHQMGGYSAQRVKQYFNLGEGIEPVDVIALGYLGDGAELTGELFKRHNTRKARRVISEYVFRNDLNNPAFQNI
jgi:nitroreductase